MFITQFQVNILLVIYFLLFLSSILILIYTARLSFQEKIIRLLIAILLPFLGIAIVLVEAFVGYIKKNRIAPDKKAQVV